MKRMDTRSFIAMFVLLTPVVSVNLGQGQGQRGARGAAGAPGGAGPAPTGQMDTLIAWVEEGRAPETLLASRPAQAGGTPRTRPLCQYPLVAKYRGTGSTDDAANFTCSTGF